ncbi:MAG: glycosyltransferase [Microgenomates group bacterium]|jgi:glycosyltransferase involved in cell wall biosynthesis|nr:glycosyltransferase [Candidatus Woesebacteria bacterium]MBP6883185.1 glycosyltransferase [Candidatus Woesebacteria bacterium]
MKISLIIPCYNEEKNIQKGVLDRIANYVQDHKHFTEVVIVDDGSTDSTKEIIKKEYLPKFKFFRLVENNHEGKARAVIEGIRQSKEPFVMFTDIDLATPLEESEKLIAQAEKGFDIVIGSRNSTREGAPILRKVMAVGFIVIRNLALGLHKIRDTQCGFKLFNRDVALAIIDCIRLFDRQKTVTGSSVSAAFDLEFLFLASKMKKRIMEVPVIWRHVETKNVTFFHDVLETLRGIAVIMYHNVRGDYNN